MKKILILSLICALVLPVVACCKKPKGKRRLCEVAPLSFGVEQVGDLTATGPGRILYLQPKNIRQQMPLVVGSLGDVKNYQVFLTRTG